MKRHAALVLVAAAIILGGLFLLVRGRRNGSHNTGAIETAEVVPADFAITLSVQGVLESVASQPVVNMGRDTQVVSVLEDGSEVQSGDVIMTLNDADTKKEVDRLERDVTEAEDGVQQQRDQASRQVENARNTLTKAEEALRLAQTQGKAGIEKALAEVAFVEKELEVAQGQLERHRRLLEERLLPVTEVEQAEDEARDKQFALEAARRALETGNQEAEDSVALRQIDVTSARIELAKAEGALAASVATAERQLAEKQSDLEEATAQLDAMQVRAPASGMLLLEQIWDDGERAIRVGDQVREGQRVANIIDSREMRVRCSIAEADIDLVRPGQEAQIRVPALGSLGLSGRVESVGSLAQEGSPWRGGTPGGKMFTGVVVLTEENQRLRPGMGAAVDVVLERVKTGLAVPVEALLLERGGTGVYVAAEQGYRWVPVEVLKRGNSLAAVTGDLGEGDRVARVRPPDELIGDVAERQAR